MNFNQSLTRVKVMVMDKVKVLALESDNNNIKKIKSVLEELSYDLVGVVDNGDDALLAFDIHTPDIVIIDVAQNGRMDGIKLAEELQKRQEITIIFSANKEDENSFERAKKVMPLGFLFKPFNAKELKIAVELATLNQSQNKEGAVQRSAQANQSFFIKVGHKLVKVSFDDIIYIEVKSDYSTLVVGRRRLNVKISLKELEPRLPDMFVRCHRNYLININAVESLDLQEGHVTIINEHLPIGRTYKDRVINMLNLL